MHCIDYVKGELGENFLRAARAGDTKKVLDLINAGVSVNITNAVSD